MSSKNSISHNTHIRYGCPPKRNEKMLSPYGPLYGLNICLP